jgi:hypothetical protein
VEPGHSSRARLTGRRPNDTWLRAGPAANGVQLWIADLAFIAVTRAAEVIAELDDPVYWGVHEYTPPAASGVPEDRFPSAV